MQENKIILLAEDEDNDVFLMRRLVQKMQAPLSLHAVKDGEEVIEYLSGQGRFADRTLYPLPSLILLDIKMPRKNGFDVLEWLKQDGSFQGIPIVIISSSEVKTDVDKALQLGATAYLVKPVPFAELKQLFLSTEEFLSTHVIIDRGASSLSDSHG